MSAENRLKPNAGDGTRHDRASSDHPNEEHHAQGEQAQRDEEIAAMQEQSKHQRVGVEPPPEVPPAAPKTALMIVGVLLVLLLIAGALTLWSHSSHEQALAKETERETVPTVAVVTPQLEKPDEDLVLPGSLQAYEESPIYARTSGYLVRRTSVAGSRRESYWRRSTRPRWIRS
jgi:hypothetical protein